MIKDNTIQELKENGLRNSIAGNSITGFTAKQEDTKDIGILAMPETCDAKCQTHGPRKQAYYRSIPAKINTNLPNRSPSTSRERLHDCSHSSITIIREQEKTNGSS